MVARAPVKPDDEVLVLAGNDWELLMAVVYTPVRQIID